MINERENTLDKDVLSDIISLINWHIPLNYSDYKKTNILRRIKRRMFHLNLSWLCEYYNYLKSNPDEVEVLVNDISIKITSFFRDSEAFDYVRYEVIPEIIENHTEDETLKVWVAGCATGEEAYSIAIIFKEFLNEINSSNKVVVYATDINPIALERASKGIYSDKQISNISKERLNVFFSRTNSGFKVNQEIRKMVIFLEHNLTADLPFTNIDLICCRNLLMHMDMFMQNKITSTFHYSLKKNGYLFLGQTDDIKIDNENFKEFNTCFKIFQRINQSNSVNLKKDYLPGYKILGNNVQPIQEQNEGIKNNAYILKDDRAAVFNNNAQDINAKYQQALIELKDLNDDLINYFRSNFNGQLFVDQDVILKKYSIGTLKFLNIHDSHIGTHLSGIENNLKTNTFIEDIQKVIKNEEIIVKELETLDGKSYQVMIMPYIKQQGNMVNGAIVTFYDITVVKTIQGELDARNKTIQQMNENVNNFIQKAIYDLNTPLLNVELALNMLCNKVNHNDSDVNAYIKIIDSSLLNFKNILKNFSSVGKF